MVPDLYAYEPTAIIHSDDDLHVLVVARDAATRYSLANLLLDAGFRVTTAATYGIVDCMPGADLFDVMVTAQSAEETTQFGLPQLVRSVDPDLPILVLERDTAPSPTIADLVHAALSRWPLRDRDTRPLH